MPFAPNSGLVYEEKLVPLDEDDDYDDSVFRCRQRFRPEASLPTCPQGAHALTAMAMNCLFRNLDGLNAELLQTIPKPLIEQIWQALCRSGRDTIALWKLFAPTGTLGLSSTRRFAKQPSAAWPLPRILKMACDAQFTWIVNLALENVTLEVSELVQIETLDNLRTVRLHSGIRRDTGLTDKILNSWAISASSGALSKLEAIFVEGHSRVTRWSLQYMSRFPALRLFCVHKCGISRWELDEAHELGWPASLDGEFMQFVQSQFKRDGRPTPTNNTFVSLVRTWIVHDRRAKPAVEKNIPLLEIDIGSVHGPAGSLDKDNLLCFQRDWNFVAPQKNTQREVIPEAPKRRRLGKQKERELAVYSMMRGER